MPKKQPQRINQFYRAVFPLDTVKTSDGQEVMEKNWGRAVGYVLARHRASYEYSPFCVPNEYICARLGTAIGLPIPPFALSKHDDGTKRLLFSTLDFNPAGLRLPPILPDICMQQLPFICSGVIVFDVWIGNEDRHDRNLAVDKTLKPKIMRVFDHDKALFDGQKLSDVDRLDALADKLVITDTDITGGSSHCLLPYLTTAEHLDEWVKRVQLVPKWLVEDACNTMVKKGINKAQAKRAIDFIRHRQGEIRRLIFGSLCSHCNISITPEQKPPSRENQLSLFDE